MRGGGSMGKKYKKKKKRRVREYNLRREDLHHLLWTRYKWRCGYAHAVRECWWFKVYLPQLTIHKYIHEDIPEIPVPAEKDLKKAWEQIRVLETMNPDIMEKMKPSCRLKWLIGVLGDDCEETITALKLEIEILEEYGY